MLTAPTYILGTRDPYKKKKWEFLKPASWNDKYGHKFGFLQSP
jgi:hypothetical protein